MPDDVDAIADGPAAGHPPPVAASTTPESDVPTVVAHPHPPRAGELTVGWRTLTATLWIGVTLAFAAVWNASVQLGLSTWWLGPRADPQPRFVQFSPFLAPVLMMLGAINHVRHIAWFGMLASLIVVGVGIADLDRVVRLALVEIAVGAVAFVISIASLTGTYRSTSGPPAAR